MKICFFRPFIYINLLLLLFSSKAFSVEVSGQKNCFAKHIKDAIKINRERRVKYLKVSQNKSKRVSNELILMEKFLYPLAVQYDRSARRYQKKGISLFCSDLIDMKFTPDFIESSEIDPGIYIRISNKEISNYKTKFKNVYKKESWPGVSSLAKNILHDLEENRSYNCLVRHFIESINRTALLAPFYISQAKSKGLMAPDYILWSYIKLQLFGLSWANSIDHKASKIQKRGIPILCNDVPLVPEPNL